MAINQNISTLPAAPSRSDSPSDFSDKADAFLAALPTLQTELNTYANEANSTETAIDTSETNAATSETNAEDWASKITGLVLTTDYSAKAYAIGGTGVTDVTGAAKEWAVKTGTTVDGSDYSAKDYAISLGTITDGSAKEWAVNTGGTVDATEYSSKDYASSQNLISTGSSKDWAIKTGSTVDGTEFSAKKYASDAEASASAAAATAGATAWSAGTTYNTNDAAIGSDGNTYRSLIDNNTGNDPVTDGGTNWLNLTATLSDQEVRGLFSASGDLTYDSSTGVFSVTTSTVPDILKPDVISPFNGETDIGETPTIKTGGYYSLFGIEQASAQFQIATDSAFSNIVYDSGVLGAVTENQVPAGNLSDGETTYYVRVEFKDINNNTSGFSDTSEFKTKDSFFDFTDPNNIGSPVAGGYLVGVIDTVAGTINSQDDYQTGERYALVVSPKSLEGAPPLKWDAQDRTGEAGSFTRWDGLSSTDSILAKNDSSYEAFEHIRSIRSSDPVPSDGGSDWYLPAMDELELMYRNLKPVAPENNTSNVTYTFPGFQDIGFNPSSDPAGSAYIASDPSRTSVLDFQDGGDEAVDLVRYWTCTDADQDSRAWIQGFTNFSFLGGQSANIKDSTSTSVRPVRRVPL